MLEDIWRAPLREIWRIMVSRGNASIHRMATRHILNLLGIVMYSNVLLMRKAELCNYKQKLHFMKLYFPVHQCLLSHNGAFVVAVIFVSEESPWEGHSKQSMELMVSVPVILQHKRAFLKSTQLVNTHPSLMPACPLRFNYEEVIVNCIKHSRLSINDDSWGRLCSCGKQDDF